LGVRASEPRLRQGTVGEVAALFLRLGLTAFGGPAAHIAMMRREVVERRRWLTDAEFLDLLGVANLLPGPSSTEMAIFLGYLRAGPLALLAAGGLFILPAMVMVLAIAWAYVRFGTLPQVQWALYGVKPVIIAIIAQALWGLAQTAFQERWLAAVAAAVAVLYLLGANVIALLLGAGAAVVLARRVRGSAAAVPPLAGAAAASAAPFSLLALFLTFLKIGAVTFGSGYVLLAFLRSDLVLRLHWLTDRQLIDAVAVGQFTPGPVFTTATFIGYLTGGLRGAIVATVAIFLPGFVLVPIAYPLVPRIRRSRSARAFLDGATAGALGLMAAVTWQLARAGIVDVVTAAVAVVSFAILIRFRLNSAWLVLGGAAVGALAKLAAF
jgi:chromate transporter